MDFPADSLSKDKVLDAELSPTILPVDHGSQRYSGGPVTEAHIRHLRKKAWSWCFEISTIKRAIITMVAQSWTSWWMLMVDPIIYRISTIQAHNIQFLFPGSRPAAGRHRPAPAGNPHRPAGNEPASGRQTAGNRPAPAGNPHRPAGNEPASGRQPAGTGRPTRYGNKLYYTWWMVLV